MEHDTHSEISEILKNSLVILARGGRCRSKRGEGSSLSRGGGRRTIGQTSIIRTGRKRRRGPRTAPGGLAAGLNDAKVSGGGGRSKGVKPGRRIVAGKPLLGWLWLSDLRSSHVIDECREKEEKRGN